MAKKAMAGNTRAAVIVPLSLPNRDKAAIGARVLAS